jgi:protease-4
VAVNLLFLAIVIAVVAVVWPTGRPRVPKRAALVVAPKGGLVEQLTGDPLDRAIARLLGRQPAETLVKDLVDGIEAAAGDDRIQAMLLDLDGFGGGGLSKLREVRAAIEEFRAAGKTVVATGGLLGQSAYYLASTADEIIVRPDGAILIPGYGAFRTYYRDAIDRLGVDVHVFKVGEYKSYPEPWERSDMSPQAREAYMAWMGQLWDGWLDDVAGSRGMSADTLRELVDHADEKLLAAGGDLMAAVQAAGLVDELGHPDRVRERMVEIVGEDQERHTFHQIGIGAYLETFKQDRFGVKVKGNVVGVLVMRGDMIGGSQPPGTVGSDSTAELIRRARHDDDVRAVVLRIDSGGGLSLTGEQLRREVELTRGAGKPVVASMSSVAASAAYHVAAVTDQIWANPSTLTGSIGVFAMFPTFQRPLERYLGMRTDGVGTTSFAGGLRPDRALDDRIERMIQSGVEWSYHRFVNHVAEGRGLEFDEVDAIGRGRIWSGADALALGLLDRLGTLEEAVAAAAAIADLGDDYGVRYLFEEPDTQERLLTALLSRFARVVDAERRFGSTPGAHLELLGRLERDAEFLTRFSYPSGPVAHSLLETD